jgi:uncharacterized protein
MLKKILLLLVLIPALIYSAFCGWLYYSQDSLLYFPTPAYAVKNVKPLQLKNDNLQLNGWVVNPNKANALLYFGGNAEALEQDIEFFQTTMPETTVYLMPYRGYSGNPGKPSEIALLSDALAMYDQVSPHHIRLRAMGKSLGSGVAVHLAAERNIDKLILITPYDSILNVAKNHYPLFPVEWILKDHYASWRRAPKISAETLVLIASNDETIHRERTDNLIRHFKQTPKSTVFEGADHVSISDAPGYQEAIIDFMAGAGASPARESTAPQPVH